MGSITGLSDESYELIGRALRQFADNEGNQPSDRELALQLHEQFVHAGLISDI